MNCMAAQGKGRTGGKRSTALFLNELFIAAGDLSFCWLLLY